MYQINLILLSDNKGLEERFTNVVFRKLGLMTLRDQYSILRINGIMRGVYYQVEHVDNAFLAHHKRPEATVFRNPRYGIEPASFVGSMGRLGPSGEPASIIGRLAGLLVR